MGVVFASLLWDAALVLVAMVVALYLYTSRHYNYWNERKVYYLRPKPFIGNVADLFLLRKSSGQFLEHIYKKSPGKPYCGFFLFDKPAILLRDPEVIKKVLVKDFNYFSDRYTNSDEKTDYMGTRNLFVIKGMEWKYLRMKLSPTFTSGKMKKMFHLVSETDAEMVEVIKKSVSQSNQGIDIKEISARCTTDVISTCAFGIKSNTLHESEAEFRQLGKKTFEYSLTRALEVICFFYAPFLIKVFGLQFFEKDANNFFKEAFWNTIKAREESKSTRNDLVDHLIKLKNRGEFEDEDKSFFNDEQEIKQTAAKFDFSGDDLVAQASIFFVAGFETSASTISFCLYELALHPEMQKRLRDEIAENLEKNNGKITYEMVFGMKYLDMVISETLRKYPTLPFLDRICVRDYYLEEHDLLFEKGTPVFVSLLGLHGDPQYFSEPQKFDPERFNDENRKNIKNFTYMPFGEGPHNCIGMRFGLMSAKTGVVHMLSQFEVQPSDNTPIPLPQSKRGIVITVDGGVPLLFKNDPLYT